MANTQNVSYGKPKIAGAISSAPLGTALPLNAIDPLDAAFKNLGYVSEDGLVNENTPESDVIKAWGGDTVLVIQTSKEDTFAYTLIEATNIDVLKEVYGQSNVTGDLATGIVIKANALPTEEHVLVIDMILKGGILKRIVVPQANLKELGEITYKDDEAIGYETTMQALPDVEGNTHYEYIQKAPTED